MIPDNDVVINAMSSDTIICNNGEATLAVEAASQNGFTLSYQWQKSPDGTSYTDIAGATGPSYNTGVLSGDTYFRCEVSSDATSGGCAEVASTPAHVQIDTASPEITGTLPTWEIVGCTVDAAPAAVTTIGELAALGLTITDNKTAVGDMALTSADTYMGSKPIVITRTYTITDECGNAATADQIINIDDSSYPMEITGIAAASGCLLNTDDGYISVTIANGIAPYIYHLSGAETITSDATDELSYTFNNLISGTYVVTVTDANGCSPAEETVVLTDPSNQLSATSTFRATCEGDNTGVITIRVTGGTTPFTYRLSNGIDSYESTSYNATYSFTNLENGTYTASVEDYNECLYDLEDITLVPVEGSYVTLLVGEQHSSSCVGEPMEDVKYIIGGSATGASVVWSPFIPLGITSHIHGGVIEISGTIEVPGTYTYTITPKTFNDCGIITTIGTVTGYGSYSYEIDTTICQGVYLDAYGIYTDVEGVYSHTFETAYGCDSTYTVTLHVTPTDTVTTVASICRGDVYDFYGEEITETGTYYHVNTDGTGCQEVAELVMTVHELPQIVINPITHYLSFENDTLIVCVGETIGLEVIPVGETRYWTYPTGTSYNEQIIVEATISNQGWYKVVVTQNTCIVGDSIYVVVRANQGTPLFTSAYYRGGVLDGYGTVNDPEYVPVEYSNDLQLVFSDPVSGIGDDSDCGYEYRIRRSGYWTEWIPWPAPYDNIVLEGEEISIGNMEFQLRHPETCEACGNSQISYSRFQIVMDPNIIVATPEIGESDICMSQDSVMMLNIYNRDFLPASSIYEWSFGYRNSDNMPYYSSGWQRLTNPGDELDWITVNGELVQGVASTPKVSVTQTPSGIFCVAGDRVTIAVRTSVFELDGTDTVWTSGTPFNFTWTIHNEPAFVSALIDESVCQNDNVYITADIDVADDLPLGVRWYVSMNSDMSDKVEMPLSMTPTTIGSMFTYHKSTPSDIYDRDLVVYDFEDEDVTYYIMAELETSMTTCPYAYDTMEIHIKPAHTLTPLTNETVEACKGSEMAEIQYQFGGGATGVSLIWESG